MIERKYEYSIEIVQAIDSWSIFDSGQKSLQTWLKYMFFRSAFHI